MAKKNFAIEFEGFDEVVKRLKKLDGDIKGTTEKALRETHKIVTRKADDAMSKSHLPAGGKYSTGKTLETLKRNADIEWEGTVASVPVGFDIKDGGLASIFLMYGTPRMDKNQTLYDAFYGRKTKNEVIKKQEEIFYEEIRRFDS